MKLKTFNDFVNESYTKQNYNNQEIQSTKKEFDAITLSESTMSDIHQLVQDTKTEKEFVDGFFKKYGKKIPKSKESSVWVASLYTDMMNESSSVMTATGLDKETKKELEKLGATIKTKGSGSYITVKDANKDKVVQYLTKQNIEINEKIDTGIKSDIEKSKILDKEGIKHTFSSDSGNFLVKDKKEAKKVKKILSEIN